MQEEESAEEKEVNNVVLAKQDRVRTARWMYTFLELFKEACLLGASPIVDRRDGLAISALELLLRE